MTRTDILIRFIKKSIAPIITAILLYNLFIGFCIANGSVNYNVSFNALRNTFRNTVYVHTAGLYRQYGRRHFYDCCQHSNRRRNRRHNLNMEIACRCLLCAVHGG